MAALAAFGSHITILKPLTSHTDRILQLSYHPSPPSLSIRTIISAITLSRSTRFKVTIHEPPSLEELSRDIQSREQNRLLRRFVVAVIFAIPTFIVSIVFMSLVKDDNSVKKLLMEPILTGNTSRIDWILFFLATPVMFYSANIFHKKSIKEIWSLWRPGSHTPIWKRFTRFGSMSLLVCVMRFVSK
jgi:Cu+-exporting ATPase